MKVACGRIDESKGISKNLIVLFSSIVVVILTGCYTFKGSSVPAHLKTVAIPLFDDQSGFGEPGLKENFTNTLISRFVSDNSLQIATRNSADCTIEGTITSVIDAPSVIEAGEQVSTRRITVTVHVTFTDLKLRKKVWEKDFSNWGDYAANSGDRTTALNDAVNKVTEDILNETVSGW